MEEQTRKYDNSNRPVRLPVVVAVRLPRARYCVLVEAARAQADGNLSEWIRECIERRLSAPVEHTQQG